MPMPMPMPIPTPIPIPTLLGFLRSQAARAYRYAAHGIGIITTNILKSDTRYVPLKTPNILVLGVCLSHTKNTLPHLVNIFSASTYCQVTQVWTVLGNRAVGVETSRQVDIRFRASAAPRMQLLNEMIASQDLDSFDYIVVCDDDVLLRRGFLDAFIGWQQTLGFSLAQPARTANSYIDHDFVRRRPHLGARETSFVEVGPVICLHRSSYTCLLPFDLASPMGWGLDLVWPCLLHANGLTLGIIDATPVDHSLRARGKTYDDSAVLAQMTNYLSSREHVKEPEIFSVIREYSR